MYHISLCLYILFTLYHQGANGLKCRFSSKSKVSHQKLRLIHDTSLLTGTCSNYSLP